MGKQGKTKISSAIGIDVGSHCVKWVEVSKSGDAFELTRAEYVPTKDNTQASIQASLKTLIGTSSLVGKKVRTSVSGPSVLIRRISLPFMTQAELKGAIRFEAEAHIPFPISDCILDFQVLDLPGASNKKEMSVVVVAVKKELVENQIKTFSNFGITPEIIDVDVFCLANAFEVLSDSTQTPAYALLNIGQSSSSFIVIEDKNPFFVREIPFGGEAVTNALMELKNISFAEAEAMKIQKTADSLDVLKEASQNGFGPLIEEIRHSIDYFENESGQPLGQIWTSGGGALAQDTLLLLSQELGKEFLAWSMAKKMTLAPSVDAQKFSKNSAIFNVALGMAIRGI